MRQPIYHDEFHEEMRNRMKDLYHNRGGKERANIRRLLKRHALDKRVLETFPTDKEKLIFLINFAKAKRLKPVPLAPPLILTEVKNETNLGILGSATNIRETAPE